VFQAEDPTKVIKAIFNKNFDVDEAMKEVKL